MEGSLRPLVVQPTKKGRVAAGETTWNGEGLHFTWVNPVASLRRVTCAKPS